MKKIFFIIPLFLGLLLLIIPADVKASGVDLVIEKVQIDPLNPQPGERATVIFSGRNIGTSNLTSGQGISNVSVSIEGFLIEGGQTTGWMVSPNLSPSVSSPLKPGDAFTYTYAGSFSSGGNKTLSFKVDNANELSESNENNNSFIKIINILTIGDLIKTATNPAVYYYGSDRKKHSFSNEATFWTWHVGSWSNHPVKVVSQDNFEAIPFGSHVTARPGENFLKFENSNKIYAVKPGGELCSVDAEYASKQTIKKIIIQQAFQADYKESLGCALNDYTTAENMPEGSIFRYENTTQNFYMSADGIRPITTADGWNNNLMNINSVLIVKDPKTAVSLLTKTAITTKEEMFKIDYEIVNRNSQTSNPAIYDRTRPCNVLNGMGQQNSNDGYNWSTCAATTCNSGYNLSNGNCILIVPIVSSNNEQLISDEIISFSVNGDYIAYTKLESGGLLANVYIKKISTGEITKITTDGKARESSMGLGFVVFRKLDGLYFYDLKSKDVAVIELGSIADILYFDVSDIKVIYTKKNDTEKNDVVYYDLNTGAKKTLNMTGDDCIIPHISGKYASWVKKDFSIVVKDLNTDSTINFSGFDDGLYKYDLGSDYLAMISTSSVIVININSNDRQIISTLSSFSLYNEVAIDSNKVVWSENGDVYMYNLYTKLKTKLNSATKNNFGVDVSNNSVLWTSATYNLYIKYLTN